MESLFHYGCRCQYTRSSDWINIGQSICSDGLKPNTYEAQFVKGNISPMGGRKTARTCDATEPGCELLTSFHCGCRVEGCLHQTRMEVHDPSRMSRRSVCFETWKLIGALMPAHSRLGLSAVAFASYHRARGRSRTQPLMFKDIVMCRERDDHPIKATGYPGFGPVPGMWPLPQACWRCNGTARAHPSLFYTTLVKEDAYPPRKKTRLLTPENGSLRVRHVWAFFYSLDNRHKRRYLRAGCSSIPAFEAAIDNVSSVCRYFISLFTCLFVTIQAPLYLRTRIV